MYCATKQFTELQFPEPHKKQHGVSELGKHYHIRFDIKIGRACTSCACIMDQPWVPVFPAQQQPCYQPIKYCTYWPVLGYFNNWKIQQLSHKATSWE